MLEEWEVAIFHWNFLIFNFKIIIDSQEAANNITLSPVYPSPIFPHGDILYSCNSKAEPGNWP